MTERPFRRFYTNAEIAPAETGYAIQLDGRPIKTPKRRVDLVVPSRPLAEAVAEEWAQQEEEVRPRRMPLTALACTALDTARERRLQLVAELARYAETDLLCYRVPEPSELARRQQELWQPLLDWAALTYDARLDVTTGILPARQPEQAIQALRKGVEALDDMRLAALSASVQAASSLVLALALVHGRIDAEQAFEAAELESTFQMEAWGEEAELLQRRKALRAELHAAQRFIRLLDPTETA